MYAYNEVFDLCKRIVDAHLTHAVECVIDTFCWVDYLANKGCRTSLPVILSSDRIHMSMLSVRTFINIPLFIRNPYMFLMTSRYGESLFIETVVYGRSIRITHRNAQIRMLKGEWGHS